jgi:hypothetical protein
LFKNNSRTVNESEETDMGKRRSSTGVPGHKPTRRRRPDYDLSAYSEPAGDDAAAEEDEAESSGIQKFVGTPVVFLGEWILDSDGTLGTAQVLFSGRYTNKQITAQALAYVKKRLKENQEHNPNASTDCPPLGPATVRDKVLEYTGKSWKLKIERSRSITPPPPVSTGDPDPDPDYRISVGPRQDTLTALAWFMMDRLPQGYDRLVPQEVMELAGGYVPMEPDEGTSGGG